MICVPTLVGWKKATRTIHSYFGVIREAKKRRWVEGGTTIRSCLPKLSVLMSTSCLPSLFQNFFNSWSLLCTHTHSCLFISFSLCHGMVPAQGRNTFPDVPMFLVLQDSSFKRMCHLVHGTNWINSSCLLKSWLVPLYGILCLEAFRLSAQWGVLSLGKCIQSP